MEVKQTNGFKHYEGLEQIQMGLDLENTHSIMSLLRNNIYSDPLESWVREIYSNAVDAHARVDNKIDPVQVSIELDSQCNYFIVRDFGNSMNKDIIANVYAKMGKSDKRSGNTEMGGWGLGAKSPLAYTDHFWIETWTIEEDVKIYRKWVQYIDSSRVGALSLLEEKETSFEKTGTRVKVPYKHKDHSSVLRALDKYLAYTTCKYELEGLELECVKRPYRFYGKGWGLDMPYGRYISSWSTPVNDSIVIIGDIPYPFKQGIYKDYISNNKLDYLVKSLVPRCLKDSDYWEDYLKFVEGLRHHKYEIYLPIGSVDLSASREDLQYTDRTCGELTKSLFKMFIEFYDHLRIDLVEHPNFPQACINFNTLYGGGIGTYFIKDLRWKKENIRLNESPKVFNNYYSDTSYIFYIDTVYGDQGTRDVCRKINTDRLDTGSYTYYLAIQDTDYKNYTKFIKYYLTDTHKEGRYKTRVLVVEPRDIDRVYSWLKDSLPTIKVSDLVADFKENAPTVSNRAKNGTFKCLVYAGSYTVRDRAERLSAYFDYEYIDKEPEEEMYYMLESDFYETEEECIDFHSSGRDQFSKYLESYLHHSNIPKSSVVYIKKLTKTFDHENWISLKDIIKNEYIKHKFRVEELCKELYRYALVKHRVPVFTMLSHTDTSISSTGMYALLQDKYNNSVNFVNGYDNKLLALLSLCNSDIRSLRERVKSTYPLITIDYCDSKFESIYYEYNDYINKFKFLTLLDMFHRINDYLNLVDFEEYISVYEKIKGLDNIPREDANNKKEELKQPSSFKLLIAKYNS